MCFEKCVAALMRSKEGMQLAWLFLRVSFRRWSNDHFLYQSNAIEWSHSIRSAASKDMKKTPITVGLLILILLLLGIQLVPVTLDNPPVEEEIEVLPAVKAILKRACYDCHSHETVWPEYSRVAPVSWLLAWDVREGRKELNFSTWNRYNQKKRNKIMKEIWEEVEEGDMPPWFYLPLHPQARLSDNDRAVLRAWSGHVPAIQEEEDDH